jgi:hypothetical protein
MQGLLEKSKLAQHTYKESHQIHWNKATVLQTEPNIIYRKYKKSTYMYLLCNLISQPSLDVPSIWIPAMSKEVKKFLQSSV